MPIAQKLKADNITIVTFGKFEFHLIKALNKFSDDYQAHQKCEILYNLIFKKQLILIVNLHNNENIIGIQTGNYAELYNISSAPGEEHSFLLDSFTQFESLARKALHSGNLFTFISLIRLNCF